MTSGQKVAVSFLISTVLFAVFTILAFAGLFSLIETKFYQPTVISGIEERLEKISDAQNRYVEILIKRFESFSSNEHIRNCVNLHPSDTSVQNREKLRANLMIDTRALSGIRIVDENGINILYSSFSSDILKSSGETITFKKYSDLVSSKFNPEISYSNIKVSDIKSSTFSSIKQNKVFIDEKSNRIIFSLPFYNSSEKYVGTILFYCDSGDINRFLYEENLIDITGYGFLATDSTGFGGYIFGLSNVGRISLKKLILEQWSIDSKTNSKDMSSGFVVRKIIPEVESNDGLENKKSNEVKILFSKKSCRDDLGFIAWIYDNDIMVFSSSIRLLFLILTFVTLFLIVYLIFNLHHDDMVVIRNRIKKFQLAFVTEALDNIDKNIDNNINLEEKKQNINFEIKKSLGSRGKRHSDKIDELLESSWNDIFNIMGMRNDGRISASVDSNELRRVLEDVLGSGTIKINADISTSVKEKSETINDVESYEIDKNEEEKSIAVEKFDAVTENEKSEEVEEAEDAESVDEIEEVDPSEFLNDSKSDDENFENVDLGEFLDLGPVEEAESVETKEEYVKLTEPTENAEEEEDLEELDDVDISYFGVKDRKYNFNEDKDFKEPETFTSPNDWPNKDPDLIIKGNTIAAQFVVFFVDYSILDDKEKNEFEDVEVKSIKYFAETESESELIQKIEEAAEPAVEVQALEKDSDSNIFSFTGFSTSSSVSELASE